jgi:hypothetical protein
MHFGGFARAAASLSLALLAWAYAQSGKFDIPFVSLGWVNELPVVRVHDEVRA